MDALKKEKIFLIVGGVLTLLLIGTVGMVDAAFYAPPGSPLFPLGKGIQTIAMSLLTQPTQKAALSLNIANSTMSALGNQNSVSTTSIIKDVANNDQNALTNITQISNTTDKQQAVENLTLSLNAQLHQLEQTKTTVSTNDVAKINQIVVQAQTAVNVTITPIPPVSPTTSPRVTETVPPPMVTQPRVTVPVTATTTGLLASITVSSSTNTPGYTLVLNADGSGSLTYTSGVAWGTTGTNKTFAKGTFSVASFATELMKVGDVSTIPTGHCIKSVSFGTTTTLTYHGKTSGDLQCLGSLNADQQQVVTDVNTFISKAKSS